MAEAYLKKELPIVEALQFAIHFLTCNRCAEAVEQSEESLPTRMVAWKTRNGAGTRISSRVSQMSTTRMSAGRFRGWVRFDVTVSDDNACKRR
jgi:hypothetical protein